MRDAGAGLLPDLLSGRAVMRLPIRRIAVLIRVEILFRFGCDYLMNAPNCAVGALIAGSNNKLGTKSSEDAFALVRSAVWQAKLYAVAKRRSDHGVGNPRVAAGGVDDDLARAQSTAGQTRLNHAQRRPVLDRASGIAPLGLGVEFHVWKFAANSREPQERRVADQLKHSLPNSYVRLLVLVRRGVCGGSGGVSGGHALKSPAFSKICDQFTPN